MLRHNRHIIVSLIITLMLGLAVSPPMLQAETESSDILAQPFVTYYWRYQGQRVLGYVQSPLLTADGYAVQYFEKGRLEDHSKESSDPAWAVTYGRLTVELMEQFPQTFLNGTTLAYGDLYRYGYSRYPVPSSFTGGTMSVDGGVFVPFDVQLRPAPGYIVPVYFWNYMNRSELFPHGWLHDIGLPLTDIFEMQVVNNGVYQTLVMQAFERTILSYNAQNTAEWQVERVNVGTDMLLAMGQTPLYIQPTPPPPPATAVPTGPKRIEIDLTKQHLYAFQGETLVYDIPVSTGRDGWETPAGNFSVYLKYLKTDMRGQAQGETWDVPDVPHVMYFRSGGYAIHGTYWHNTFGTGARLSHGCVNLPLDMAAALYEWTPIGTPVIVHY